MRITYLEQRRANRRKNQEAVINAIEAGANFTRAAKAAKINRRTIWEWSKTDSDFAILLELAWLTGRKQREYNAWLNHPFRGLRPPTGKRSRARPRFSYR